MRYTPPLPPSPPVLRCQHCEIEDGEQLQCSPPAVVLKRACGRVLCDECYREHLTHDPSVGVYRCMACYDSLMTDWAEMYT